MQPKRNKKKWSELTGTGKAAVIGAVATHVVLVGMAHADLSKRDASQIRGPKWIWRMLTASNSTFVGAYYLFARRPTSEH